MHHSLPSAPRATSLGCLLFLFAGTPALAQTFPDPYGEPVDKIISFWKNAGQVVDTDGNKRIDVRFVSEGTQPKMYLLEKGRVALTYGERDPDSTQISHVARIDVTPVNGAQQITPTGLVQRSHVKHFWLEHTMPDPVLNVPGFARVSYEDVYPGIDWHWYGGSAGTKMAFVCAPGSNPYQITLRFEGQDSLKLDWQGALKIHLQDRWLKFEQATAYQYDAQGNITFMSWGAAYELVDGLPHVKFNFDSYDPDKPLVFFVGQQPLPMGGGPNDDIPYSTYLGTAMKDEVNEIAIADNGDYYAVGNIEDYDFPAEVGLLPLPSWPAFTQTGFIAKFDKDYVKQWAGYYGKKLRSIALDEVNGRIIVGGNNATNGLYPQQYGNGYFFNTGYGSNNNSSIGMFSMDTPTEGPQLLWSTRWKSTTLNKVLVDANGRIYIAGSISGTGLAVQAPAGSNTFHQPVSHGGSDGYVACFDANTNLLWSTYYGGEGDDHVLDMAIHEGTGRLAIVGRTGSLGHPGAGNCQVIPGWLPQCAGGGAYHQIYHNGNGQNGATASDGFIAWFSLDMGWIWSTRFGGTTEDHITSAVFAPDGSFYVAGYILASQSYNNTLCAVPVPADPGFPHCIWTAAADQMGYGGLDDHFVARFGSDRSLQWSRFAGGGGHEFASSGFLADSWNTTYPLHGPVIAVDAAGDIYLAGSTTTGGSTHGNSFVQTIPNGQYYASPYNNGMSEPPPTDRSDVYVMKFGGGSGNVVYGAFYGGRGGVPVNQTGWDLNQDVITCMATRDSRLFIGGSTASQYFFPVNALDGVSSSFLQYTAPLNQAPGATDITHAFIAQLSWLYDPVGIDERGTEVRASLAAWFNEEGGLSIELPEAWSGTPPVIDLFDARGRLVASKRAVSAGARLAITAPGLASGLYAGHLRSTPYTFKVSKP